MIYTIHEMFFLTGFPGFLGTEVMMRTLKRDQNARFNCLIQEKFLPLAEARRLEIAEKVPGSEARIQFSIGDLTSADLGLGNSNLNHSEITEVFHFAAVYDLNVTEELGKRVNVQGTKNILDFCGKLQNLNKLHYVSTCYVSGKHDGVFHETDLDVGQTFNNFYESTKFEAEVLVREKMKQGLRATIYRPSIVVGNSKTGETQKFDGPYYVMQWLLRQQKHAYLPKLGDPDRYTINLVPSDYVVDAMDYLCTKESSVSKTFHLADPHPLTIAQTVQDLSEKCGKILVQIPLPRALAKWAVGNVPGLEKWLKIPRLSLDYFVHPTHYDTSEAQNALEGSGISCPAFPTYSQKLVDYMQKSPDLRTKALV